MGQALLVFAGMVALDFLWARYIHAASDGSAVTAAATAGLIYALSAGVTVSYMGNHLLIAPAIAGAFVGTWLGVVRQRDGGS